MSLTVKKVVTIAIAAVSANMLIGSIFAGQLVIAALWFVVFGASAISATYFWNMNRDYSAHERYVIEQEQLKARKDIDA